MNTTMRIRRETRDKVARIAVSTGRPMSSVVDAAVSAYEKQVFWHELAAEVARTKDDPAAWQEVEEEWLGESGALRDALDER